MPSEWMPVIFNDGEAMYDSNIARADHAKDLRYAAPYNFAAAGIAAVLYVLAGVV